MGRRIPRLPNQPPVTWRAIRWRSLFVFRFEQRKHRHPKSEAVGGVTVIAALGRLALGRGHAHLRLRARCDPGLPWTGAAL